MKTFLMHRDRDFALEREPLVNELDLIQDLELDRLFGAMSRGDDFLGQVARSAVLSGLSTPAEIRYRQNVLSDCLRQPDVVRALHQLAGEAVAGERAVYRSIFSDRPEALLNRSVTVLDLFVQMMRRLRGIAAQHAAGFTSDGFVRFFARMDAELDDDYFRLMAHHLGELRFRGGLLMSAQLGEANQGVGHLLRMPRRENRGLLKRAWVKKPAYTMTIPERDEAGFRALSEIRNHGLNLVANAAAQSADHVLGFFTALRAETGFYVGCLNLFERLTDKGEPVCFPEPQDGPRRALTARGLYEPCLSLHLEGRATGNDLDADGTSLIMITGANQGGKSTLLRSLGVAHLMMQSGMFVGADAFSASVSQGVFTHYRREEDATMASGKLDEELSRMSEVVEHVRAGAILLCNESFAATNEREGSQIAKEVVRAMVDAGIRVCFVTHLFDLAHSFYETRTEEALFLRAERQSGGQRTFRLVEAEPLPTSYGEDVYRRIFGGGVRQEAATGSAPSGAHELNEASPA